MNDTITIRFRAGPKKVLSHDRRAMVAMFLLLVGIYGLCAGGHTYSSDEECMLATTETSVDNGSPVVPVDDGNNHLRPITTGRTGDPVSITGLGQSAVAIPFEYAGKAVSHMVKPEWRDYTTRIFTGWTNSFVTAFGVLIFFAICRRLGASLVLSMGMALTYGFGTWAWPHAKTFFSEPLTTTLMLASVLCAVKAAQLR